jgi:alpha-mannosidase/mannosylglycerate hydrolase
MGIKMFYIRCNQPSQIIEVDSNYLENDSIKVTVNKNGSLNITYKQTGTTYENQNIYESTTDAGNSYMYYYPQSGITVTTKDNIAKVEIISNNNIEKKICITNSLKVPAGISYTVNPQLAKDYREKGNYAVLSNEKVEINIKTYVTLIGDRIDIKSNIINTAKNHRIRAVFDTGITCNEHYVDNAFNVVRRDNKLCSWWENPCTCERQHAFVTMMNDKEGVMIANKGLMEYEILDERKIAITLLRGIGEVGDWGYFPTDDGQCLGEGTFETSFIPYEGTWLSSGAHKKAYAFNIPPICEMGEQDDKILLDLSTNNIVISALKKAEYCDNIIVRAYNVSDDTVSCDFMSQMLPFDSIYEVNLNEDRQGIVNSGDGKFKAIFKPYEIKTFEIVYKESNI